MRYVRKNLLQNSTLLFTYIEVRQLQDFTSNEDLRQHLGRVFDSENLSRTEFDTIFSMNRTLISQKKIEAPAKNSVSDPEIGYRISTKLEHELHQQQDQHQHQQLLSEFEMISDRSAQEVELHEERIAQILFDYNSQNQFKKPAENSDPQKSATFQNLLHQQSFSGAFHARVLEEIEQAYELEV